MKYVIVTRPWNSEPIDAESPEDAVEDFATIMDMDMNIYFEAIPATEADEYHGECNC